MGATLIGISPSTDGLIDYIKQTVTTVNGVSIKWSSNYSMCRDEERDNAKTILLTATTIVEEESDVAAVMPEDIVSHVQESLENDNIRHHRGGTAVLSLPSNGDEQNFFCEMWANPPVELPLRPLSGYDFLNVPNELWDDHAVSIMKQYGIVVQQSPILNRNQVNALKDVVDGAISNVEALIKKHIPEITIGEDSFVFKEIASRNLERFDLRLDTIVEATDFVKENLLTNSNVQSLLKGALGTPEEIDFDISVVYSRPGAINQRWHADGNHQNVADDKDPSIDPYALCLFIPLIDLDHDTGFTQFWPGTHLYRDLVGFGPIAELANATFDGMFRAGSAVWYDYRLLHRGIYNVSNVLRPVVQVIFKQKWYVEKRNYGKESIVRKG